MEATTTVPDDSDRIAVGVAVQRGRLGCGSPAVYGCGATSRQRHRSQSSGDGDDSNSDSDDDSGRWGSGRGAEYGVEAARAAYEWLRRHPLLNELGAGTYGNVRAHVDLATGARVAVKRLFVHAGARGGRTIPGLPAEFLSELRALGGGGDGGGDGEGGDSTSAAPRSSHPPGLAHLRGAFVHNGRAHVVTDCGDTDLAHVVTTARTHWLAAAAAADVGGGDADGSDGDDGGSDSNSSSGEGASSGQRGASAGAGAGAGRRRGGCRVHLPPALPLEAVRQVVTQVARALAGLHHRGILHQDVKPSNILLRRAAGGGGGVEALVVDFGMSIVDPAAAQVNAAVVASAAAGVVSALHPPRAPTPPPAASADAAADVDWYNADVTELSRWDGGAPPLVVSLYVLGCCGDLVIKHNLHTTPSHPTPQPPLQSIPPTRAAVRRAQPRCGCGCLVAGRDGAGAA